MRSLLDFSLFLHVCHSLVLLGSTLYHFPGTTENTNVRGNYFTECRFRIRVLFDTDTRDTFRILSFERNDILYPVNLITFRYCSERRRVSDRPLSFVTIIGRPFRHNAPS